VAIQQEEYFGQLGSFMWQSQRGLRFEAARWITATGSKNRCYPLGFLFFIRAFKASISMPNSAGVGTSTVLRGE
jgi:hypothetical protein